MFKEQFQRAYGEGLEAFRLYYDDFHLYGDPRGGGPAFYFVPGINGTPGQIRFALASLVRRFGPDLFVECCRLPEFGPRVPVWEKYRRENVEKKRQRVAVDLKRLLGARDRLYVICSSNGFYDFLWAAHTLAPEEQARLHLLWVACAPDRFGTSPWVEVFFALSGFEFDGCRWAAVPNHDLLTFMNPETSVYREWREPGIERRFYKGDLESRFRVGGIHWVYTSPECFNRSLADIRELPPFQGKADVLAAARDGYWYGKPPSALQDTLRRYLIDYRLFSRPESHLWVVKPPDLNAFLEGVAG